MDVAGRMGWVLVIDALLCAAIAFTAAETGDGHADAAWVISTLGVVLVVTGASLLVLAKDTGDRLRSDRSIYQSRHTAG
jgi:hypothetical protein